MNYNKKIEIYIYEKIKDAIESLNSKILKDIYVISFYKHNDRDDLRFPIVTVGYNTLSNLIKEVKNASDKDEAIWNYAFWLQNEKLTLFDDNDKAGRELLIRWENDIDLYYSEEELKNNFERSFELGKKINEKFENICIKVIQELHNNNIVKNKFKKEIPIIIHELEYYDKTINLNISANPKYLITDFINWVKNN